MKRTAKRLPKQLQRAAKLPGKLKRAAKLLVIGLVCFFALAPFVWTLLVSIRKKVDIFSGSIFATPTLENYRAILADSEMLGYFANSVLIALGSTLASLCIGGLAAYGFARYNWKAREQHAFFLLSQKFVPAMAVVIPYFLMAGFFRLLDTRTLLIIAHMSFNIPFVVWMLRSFIEEIPLELEEAATIDGGCNKLQILRAIVLPLAAPGLAATAIFCLIASWNEFAFANFLTTVYSKTVPTSVMKFLSISGVKWGEMAATGVLAEIPVVLFALFMQKHLVRGLTFGALKA